MARDGMGLMRRDKLKGRDGMGWDEKKGDVDFGFSCLLSPMKVYRFQKKFPEGILVDREQLWHFGLPGLEINGMKLTKKGWRNTWGGFFM